jgi:hypothetical protein
MQTDIRIDASNGRTTDNLKIVRYIRPVYECFNRARKVTGFTSSEVNRKINNVVAKWYSPKVILYKIEGWVIASNSKRNALCEYWRVCDMKDVGKEFEVQECDATPADEKTKS